MPAEEPLESELEPAGTEPDIVESDGLGPVVPVIPVYVDSGSVPPVSETVAVAEPLAENLLEGSELTLAGIDPEGAELDRTGPGVPETLADVADGSVPAVPEETPGTVAVPLPDVRVEPGSLAVVPERVPEEVVVPETPTDVDNGSVPVSDVVPEAVVVLLPETPADVPGIIEETPEAVAVLLPETDRKSVV